jgi:hypothetical protein
VMDFGLPVIWHNEISSQLSICRYNRHMHSILATHVDKI